MNILHRRNKKKSPPRKIPPGYLVELRGLEYAEDFNLPEQAARLAKVYEHTLSGGSFEVRKVMGGRTKRSLMVAAFDDFPSEPQVLDAVYESYGGGQYSIHLKGQPGPVKTFNFAGRSTYHPEGPPPKTAGQDLRESSARYAKEFVDQEIGSGSEIGQLIKRALFAKAYGVELPEPLEPTREEVMITELLEDYPELRDAYAKVLLRRQGVKIPEEKTEIEQLIDKTKELGMLKKGIADFERAGEPEPNLARDLLEALAAEAPKLLRLYGELKTRPSQASAGPSTPLPQREPNRGSRKVQKEPGLGPVPAEELSLLERSEALSRPTHDPDRSDAGPETDGQSKLDLGPEEARTRPIQETHAPSTSPNPATMGFNAAPLRNEFAKHVDWPDLERGINGDPADYVEHLLDEAQNQGSGYSAVLVCFFMDPASFLEALNVAVDRLLEPGGGEDYESAVLIQRFLNETEEGRRWLEGANAAAVSTYERMASDIEMTRASGSGITRA
ncbi:MAG: hypothetical protein IH963_01770 [Chloroflexi bacterium]|nr:hypothetical protein [Chloroflexota bacterium]